VIVFRERVLPSALNLALPALLFPSVFAVMLPIDAPLALPVAVLVTLAFVGLIFSTAPTVILTETTFTAKGATIELGNLGNATVIQKSEIFSALGPELDSRAWLAIQASVKGLVKIEVLDPKDPTPYWLVSTRSPAKLAALING
jgi:hypothetical protein